MESLRFAEIIKINYNRFSHVCNRTTAYRSVPVHPPNHQALCQWKFKGCAKYTYLMDTRLPFGCIFHRLTQAVRGMMARRGFSMVVVYLDDCLVIGKSHSECQTAYNVLCELLVTLAFHLSSSKVVPPCQCLTFLCVQFDIICLSLSLPVKKLTDLCAVITTFIQRTRASKRQLQQLAGRLNWACKVVYGGRTFLRKVLDLMNTMPHSASKC